MSVAIADEYVSFRATPIEEEELVDLKKEKVFCPTGPGGGRDATCSPGKKPGSGTIVDKHGTEYKIIHRTRVDAEGNTRHIYDISTPDHNSDKFGPNVGNIELNRAGDAAMHVHVNQEFQRRGIATAAYAHVEKHLGIKLKENWATTEDGAAFWDSRNKQRGQEWVQNLEEGQKTALTRFFDTDYPWMRALQKVNDPIEPPTAVSVFHSSFSDLVSTGKIKAGEIYDGPDIKEFVLGVAEEKWPRLLSKGQKVLSIGKEGSIVVEPTDRQKQKAVNAEEYDREDLLNEHEGSEQLMADFKAALDSAPVYKGTVHRALSHENLNADILTRDWDVGKVIDIKADSSSTTDEGKARKFLTESRMKLRGEPVDEAPRGVLLKVKTKSAADTREMNPGEMEVMLRRNTAYRISSIDRSQEHIHVEMEEI